MKSNVMRIIAERGRKDLAKVYIGLMKNCSESYLVEFVESIQPPEIVPSLVEIRLAIY